MIRLPGSAAEPFVRAANTPRLLAAFDEVVGRGRWHPRPSLGTFPIRFPSPEDPGDAGWHIDGSFRVGDELYVDRWSRDGRCSCCSCSPTSVPTMRRPGFSWARIWTFRRSCTPRASVGSASARSSRISRACRSAPSRWPPGVYLCHPFLVHAASWPHRGTQPRFVAQPPLAPVAPLQLDRADQDDSAVETAVRIGLGLPR